MKADENSFTALAEEISQADEILNITHDYTFNESIDSYILLDSENEPYDDDGGDDEGDDESDDDDEKEYDGDDDEDKKIIIVVNNERLVINGNNHIIDGAGIGATFYFNNV